MADFADEIGRARKRLDEAAGYLDLAGLRRRLAGLEVEVGRPDLWDDTAVGERVTREYGQLHADVSLLDSLEAKLADAESGAALAAESGAGGPGAGGSGSGAGGSGAGGSGSGASGSGAGGSGSGAGDEAALEEEVGGLLAAVSAELDRLELRSLFTGEHDELDAVCEIHAKDGGTDAQDWAEMMLRMYQRWAESRGFEFELDEVSAGQEAGILSATFIVRGRWATGLVTSERGVHRLVRMSPFDSQHRRQTSFALFSAVPFLEDLSGEVIIEDKDLRIDTYRSSGAGGQHVNVTDSAVRITHLPTGIVVAVQNERSQHQNKDKAMQILAAKLAEKAREDRHAEMDALAGSKALVGWGSQIRSYVLAPFQLVKDLRTDFETANVSEVLDGALDPFMEAYLRWRRAGQSG